MSWSDEVKATLERLTSTDATVDEYAQALSRYGQGLKVRRDVQRRTIFSLTDIELKVRYAEVTFGLHCCGDTVYLVSFEVEGRDNFKRQEFSCHIGAAKAKELIERTTDKIILKIVRLASSHPWKVGVPEDLFEPVELAYHNDGSWLALLKYGYHARNRIRDLDISDERIQILRHPDDEVHLEGQTDSIYPEVLHRGSVVGEQVIWEHAAIARAVS